MFVQRHGRRTWAQDSCCRLHAHLVRLVASSPGARIGALEDYPGSHEPGYESRSGPARCQKGPEPHTIEQNLPALA